MKIIIPILIILLFIAGVVIGDGFQLFSPCPNCEEPAEEIFEVARIIDGDTIVMENEERVRYLGIDTPERGECYYEEANEMNKRLVLLKDVKLEKDVQNFPTYRDHFCRQLRYVWMRNYAETGFVVNVNEYLIRYGFAKYYPYGQDLKYGDILEQAEQEAKDNKRGMWGECY